MVPATAPKQTWYVWSTWPSASLYHVLRGPYHNTGHIKTDCGQVISREHWRADLVPADGLERCRRCFNVRHD